LPNQIRNDMNLTVTLETYLQNAKDFAAECQLTEYETNHLTRIVEYAFTCGEVAGLKKAQQLKDEASREADQMKMINDRLLNTLANGFPTDPMTSRFGQSYTGEVGK